MAKQTGQQVEVYVTNLKKLLPSCKRCRIRSDEMLRDEYQPVLCKKCVEVIKTDWPHMVPEEKPDFEKSRECLFNHDRECNCWADGLKFPNIGE